MSTPSATPDAERRSALVLTAAALLFSAMALCAKAASAHLPGPQVAWLRFVVGLPDSMLAGVYVAAERDPDIRYVAVTNEAEGASIAAGGA